MAVRATGRVIRFSIQQEAVWVRIDVEPTLQPLENWFKLSVETLNYNSFFSMVVAAAANRWPLTIRATKEIVPTIVPPSISEWLSPGLLPKSQ